MNGSSEYTNDRPLRVLHVVAVLALAGMEYGVIKLVNRLDPARFEPLICSLSYASDAALKLLREGVAVVQLHKQPGRSWRMVGRLASILRRERIDIVHSHNWSTFLYAVLAARFARVPVIIHGEHGHDDPSQVRERLGTKRLLASACTHLVAVSEDLAAGVVRHWGVPPERVSPIVNGVDLDRFGDRDGSVSGAPAGKTEPGSFAVVTIGNARPVKDLPTLVRAFSEVHAAYPLARLDLIGKGDWTEVEALVGKMGLEGAVRILGQRIDVEELLRQSDVYVNSSVFEGMSNTILEAMASRRPVVATAVGGNPELVQDGVTGFLVPPGDDKRLAERIKLLLGDREMRERMGRAGRTRVEHRHALSTMVKAYADLYTETWWRQRLRRRSPARELWKCGFARGVRLSHLDRLVGSQPSGTLTILTYHRVLPLPEALGYPFQGMMLPRDLFEAQIAYLSARWRVLPLDEAVLRLGQGSLPRRAVAVTFDDGYRDNFHHAWPVLRKVGIPATIFLVTGAVDGTLRLWWDEVAECIHALNGRAPLSVADLATAPGWLASLLKRLPWQRNGGKVAQRVVDRLNSVRPAERAAALQILRGIARNASPPLLAPMLGWDEVREMHRGGIEFGGHTASHAFLDELDPVARRREIEDSVRRITEELGSPVRSFAYPRGRSSEDVQVDLERVGIGHAVTNEPGANSPRRGRYALRRFDSGYAKLQRGFDAAVFELEMGGWFHTGRRVLRFRVRGAE